MKRLTITGIILFSLALSLRAAGTKPPMAALFQAVDLRVSQQQAVKLADGSTATVTLLGVRETRDNARQALREALVDIEINGEKTTLHSANYQLPVTVGGVQIDCPIVQGCVQPGKNPWALDADARLRLWPAGSPWIEPGTFVYPARQRWFASDTQMANEPTFVDGGEDPGRRDIYYHWGLDAGGAEGLVPVASATDGQVVSVGKEVLPSEAKDTPVQPRYDVVYIKDSRNWYYRYSHLFSIDPSVKLGKSVRMGQQIGLLGKEGGSGGWSHLHFDISALQPSGRYGIVEGYAFYWQSYREEHPGQPLAVARPHHLIWSGETVVLDGSNSWSGDGPGGIASYQWTFSDGTSATGPRVERRYDRPGRYSEVLKITDGQGRIAYDFAVVLVLDRQQPKVLPPAIHAVYWPTEGLHAGDEITFKVRSFRIEPTMGHETWDFGDGSPAVTVQSDDCVKTLAKDGYAITTHRYAKPGDYLVRVERRTDAGVPAMAHLRVQVAAEPLGEEPLPAPPAGKTWKLIWRDEFDGEKVDESKWEVQDQKKRKDLGMFVREALSLDGQGHLVVTMRKHGELYGDGGLRTKGRFEHAFGFYTARIKFQTQPGHWPGFWLTGPGVNSVGNEGRDGTEIDIMEKPWLDDRVQHTLHWDGYLEHHRTASHRVTAPGLTRGWHTFSVWWKPEEYIFYVDGRETWRSNAGGVCQVPLYVYLSGEVGRWSGDPAQAKLPDSFCVDYVRVYDLADESVSNEKPPKN